MAEKQIKVRLELDDKLTPKLKKATTGIKKQTQDAKKNVDKLSTSFSGLEKAVGAVSIAAAGMVAFRAASKLMSESTELAKKQIQAEAKLGQVLIATGHAAGLSAKELKTMASELQKVTTYGDEATIEAQALLLTFREIGGDVFPRALKAVQDTALMFGGLDSASIQLGKALNDPITGMSALTRVGITFSEQQKDQIKQFQSTNQIAKAQGIILAEVEKQYGGVSEALAKTPVGKLDQANGRLGDIKETLGKDIIPLQTKWVEWQIETVKNITDIARLFGLIKKEETVESLTKKFDENTTAIKWNLAEAEKIGNNWLMGVSKKGALEKASSLEIENKKIQEQINLLKQQEKAEKDIAAAGAANKKRTTVNVPGASTGAIGQVVSGYDGLADAVQNKINAEFEAMGEIELPPGFLPTIPEGFVDEETQKYIDFKEQLSSIDYEYSVKNEEQQNAFAEKEIERQKQTQEMKLDAAANMLKGFSQLIKVAGKDSKEAAIAAKALAVTAATIDAVRATLSAFSAGMSVGGPQAPAIAAAYSIGAGIFGAAQVATIASAKFADGGIVGGSKYQGDQINARLNSGEMVLNGQQQNNLFSAIKSGGVGGANITMSDTIVINGNADQATVDAITKSREDQLENLKDMIYELKMSGNF